MTLDLTLTLQPFWASLNNNLKRTYRAGWQRWSAWCATVGIDPVRASVPQAQAWVDSMVRDGLAPSYITRNVSGARNTLEYLAMMAHRPYEPFGMVVLPRHAARVPTAHDTLTLEAIATALTASVGDPRAHGVLWACAGMGLGPADLAGVNQPGRIKRVGTNLVAVVTRHGKGELIPFPRELVVVYAEYGWPVNASSANSAKVLTMRATRPYLFTNAMLLREWHRVEAGPVLHPLRYLEHPSIAVCDLLREAMS